MRELKAIKCSGDVVQGDIIETQGKDELWYLYFRMNSIVTEDVKGNDVEKTVRGRYSLERLKELKNELEVVISRMEKESRAMGIDVGEGDQGE